jgi:hypothetical protein
LRLLAFVLFSFSLAACSTVPQEAKGTSTEAAAETGVQPAAAEKKICRDLSTTGSYGPRHACHSKAEWEKIDALS